MEWAGFMGRLHVMEKAKYKAVTVTKLSVWRTVRAAAIIQWCCCLAAKSCLTLCHSRDCSTPDSSALQYLPEFAQIHVHWVSDALTISSSAALFCFCLKSFPASGSFPVSQLFTSSGQSIGASASVLPVNIYGWFPLGLTGLIPFLSRGLSWTV